MTPLHEACLNNMPFEIIKFLIDKGASIKAQTTVSIMKNIDTLRNKY